MLTLGTAPDELTVVLSPGADFECTLEAEREGVPYTWPASAEVELEVGLQTWPATLDGNGATWSVDQALVDQIIEAGHNAAKLWYVEGNLRQLWAVGRVSVRGA